MLGIPLSLPRPHLITIQLDTRALYSGAVDTLPGSLGLTHLRHGLHPMRM